MSLNDEEIQQLELLAILREHGKLTEEQFQIQTSAILRTSAVRKAPKHPLIHRMFQRPASTSERIKPLIPVPKREVILERHYLPDDPSNTEPGLEPSVLSNEEEIRRYAHRKRKPSLSTLVSMRQERKNRNSSLFVTLATVITAVVVTSFLATSDPLEAVIEKIESVEEDSTAASSLQLPAQAIQPSFVEPLFGPSAERQCRSICAGRSAAQQPVCLQSCERFSLGQYGRRITYRPLNPQVEAEDAAHTCRSKPLGKRAAMGRRSWSSLAQSQLKLMRAAEERSIARDFGSTRLRYEKSIAAANELGAPKQSSTLERSFTQAVVRAACMRSHLSLVELGLAVAHESDDSYSKRFFQAMYRVLQESAQSEEAKALSLAAQAGVSEES